MLLAAADAEADGAPVEKAEPEVGGVGGEEAIHVCTPPTVTPHFLTKTLTLIQAGLETKAATGVVDQAGERGRVLEVGFGAVADQVRLGQADGRGFASDGGLHAADQGGLRGRHLGGQGGVDLGGKLGRRREESKGRGRGESLNACTT